MQVKTEPITKNKLKITIVADKKDIDHFKNHVIESHLNSDLKIPGFRKGKVPPNMAERYIDPAKLQSKFLEEIVDDHYVKAIRENKVKVIADPKITITKFVPYEQLEFLAEVDVIGKVKLPDYEKIKISKKPAEKVKESEIDEVIERIQNQFSEKKDVNRASKVGDEVWIDFEGFDTKGEPVKGADGKNYPLLLGSNTFIPGFEDNLVGLKPNTNKTFKLVFPKTYHLKALANREVEFRVDLLKVQEVVKPPVNDELAKKAGPFENLNQLKEDIKKHLLNQKVVDSNNLYETELIEKITEKSVFDVPEILIEREIENKLSELKQNLAYKGLTFKEFLDQESVSEEDYKLKTLKPDAIDRLKASIVLAEIADIEKIVVSSDELDIRLDQLKQQYKDESSQEQMSKPEFKNQIANRILIEKTIDKLVKLSED